MIKTIEAKGSVLISPLANGEISLAVSHGKGTMGVLLTKKQANALRKALFDCIYPAR